MMYDINIDGKSCMLDGIYIVKRPNINTPLRRFNEYDIPGVDGLLYEDQGKYEDVELTIEFNYMTNKDTWHEIFRKCKRKFMNAKTIELSDDKSFYHIVKKTIISTNERTSLRIGRFSVTFILDPYYYHVLGREKYDISQVLYNSYDESRPLYIIKGEGMCHLYVNGTDCICNVGQNLYIDTSLHLSYREDGELQNTSINADYESLYLKEGINEISISDNFEIQIIPNWRCL